MSIAGKSNHVFKSNCEMGLELTHERASRIDGVESRLNHIERQMDQLVHGARSASTGIDHHVGSSSSSTGAPPLFLPQQYVPDQYLPDFDYFVLDDVNRLLAQQTSESSQHFELKSSSASETVTAVNSSYPSLPPLAGIQAAIENYFTQMNPLMPLFSQTAFFRMLHNYYAFNCQNPRTVWAAINVVLALATRLPTIPSNNVDMGSGDIQVARYVNNAQSVLAELITGDVDLLGLQVVIGLVIIFHTLKDSRPAVVLAGMAVRLAHRLRLHTREGYSGLSASEALQRNRVFWITYLFDKDICLRYHTPSAQVDVDIDVDLPLMHPEDGAGHIYTNDGQLSINFFRHRVRLAHIQGRLHDLLFATRSTSIALGERQARITLLHNQLEHWRQDLPSELQAEFVANHVDRAALFWLCMMHFSYLGCLVMIHGIWSFDAEWRKRLTTKVASSENVLTIDGAVRTVPPLPGGWRDCVMMSRKCIA